MIVVLSSFAKLILCITFSITYLHANASSEYKNITDSSGKVITYKNTNIKVEVPKTYSQKTEEFRGVWVSPFAGDISGYSFGDEAWKQELLTVLDVMEQHNLNAIVFHIRTHNDALYNTKLAPKSNYISSANFNKWDYLTWFIEECHSRGIEFHAWLNPYRISSTKTTMDDIKKKYSNFRNNPAYKEENVLLSDSGAILDPGSPDVRNYLIDICMEIIKKYDVDAIHFDDYFYLAGINDTETYKKYKENYGNPSIANFRRMQVDEFIENLSNEMKEYNQKNNKCVQLGISPSGIYQNGGYSSEYKYDNNGTLVSPLYSNSAGYEHYDTPLYSDTKKWIDQELIDYITPQLYGSFENTGMPYADVVDWWAHVVKYKKVNLYTGLGIYQTNGNSDKGWYKKNNETFTNTLLYNQKHEEIDGFCLYQYRTLVNNGLNKDFQNVFKNMLNNKAITPKLERYSLPIDKVQDVKLVKGTNSYSLVFDSVNNACKYAIYKAEGIIDINNTNHLIGVLGNSEFNSFKDLDFKENVNYGVVAINQANQKSELVTINTADAIEKIDFDFAKFNEITVSGTISNNSYFMLIITKPTVYVGDEVSYKLYSSYNKTDWELIDEYEQLTTPTKNIRLQFNNQLKPIYYKVVIENEFGTMESDIITVDYSNLKINTVLDYILNIVKEKSEEIFE